MLCVNLPGSIFMTFVMPPPMPETILYCFRKSLKSNLFCIILFVRASASFSLMFFSAISTSDSTSPMPAHCNKY